MHSMRMMVEVVIASNITVLVAMHVAKSKYEIRVCM